MRRFYLDNSAKIGDQIKIEGDQFFHMNKVLRIKSGEKIVVCFDDGNDYICEICSSTKEFAFAQILEIKQTDRESHSNVTLFQALPKGDKLELIVQKITELGLKKLVPFKSNFCEKKILDVRVDRLKKIAIESAKQCGRSEVLKIENPIEINDLKSKLKDYDCVILANETERQESLDFGLQKFNNIAIIVGSEGGFSKEEIEMMTGAGAKSITLGKRILRCETAAIALPAIIMFLLGELK
ncbi:MAG: RsmE family RNA methyltransferase [Clostridia bacterium]